MTTHDMSAPGPGFDDAVAVLRQGGVVCVPTETFYGLAADIASTAALALITEIKGRDPSSPFGLMAADIAQARRLAAVWPALAQTLAERFWPGPLTLVVPAAPGLPDEIVGPAGGVGVRVPGHDVPVALARALGRPITATSANPGGLPPAMDIASARAYFGDRIAYLDRGRAPGERGSTVVAINARGRARLLRAGPVVIPPALLGEEDPTQAP